MCEIGYRDELEKSIIANIADDVKVKILGNRHHGNIYHPYLSFLKTRILV